MTPGTIQASANGPVTTGPFAAQNLLKFRP
jgi:hypothetical protein